MRGFFGKKPAVRAEIDIPDGWHGNCQVGDRCGRVGWEGELGPLKLGGRYAYAGHEKRDEAVGDASGVASAAIVRVHDRKE